jgi:phosphodiesterase/alkaline phosphatase D-like protein
MDGNDKKSYSIQSVEAGVEQRILLDKLSSNTDYNYEVYADKQRLAQGRFSTAPSPDEKSTFRLTFGS